MFKNLMAAMEIVVHVCGCDDIFDDDDENNRNIKNENDDDM